MQKILIIEDEAVMRQGLADLLQSNGYQPVALTERDLQSGAQNLSQLLAQISALQPKLILLDINLGTINGELLLKTLRTQQNTPVIMLTSSSSEMDEVLSMSYGADDYITKPYNPQILLLRIAAVLKRAEGANGPIIFHNLQVDLTRGVIENDVTEDGPKRVLLTKNEMIILSHLLSHQGAIVTRDALMTDLWNNHEYINDNALTTNVSRLRSKLASLGLENSLETRKGVGYILS